MPPSCLVETAQSERRGAEVGPLEFWGKSARVIIQLIHSFFHFARLGASTPQESVPSLKRRAVELHKLCINLLDHMQVTRSVDGAIPERGLLVTNHVGFMDIMFLSAVQPMVFVSKSDVAGWPGVGAIATGAGTLYVERRRRSDVGRANAALNRALDAGLLVTLFPEGTSSDGAEVLPFQPSLLQAAVDSGVTVTPGHVRYTGMDGVRADDIAYFGDRDLLPCLVALLNRRRTTATLRCGAPMMPSNDRKQLALALHTAVSVRSPEHAG